MKKIPFVILVLNIFALTLSAQEIPHLQKHGSATHLIVEGSPFLVRGGELGNSSASNLDYLGQYWDKFQGLNMNTVVAPIYWDLFEPVEGEFDYTLIDGLIEDAHENGMKLVILWFASWKNSMSCYSPEWVKIDYERFPRIRNREGVPFEILSPFDEENYVSDARAFRELMKRIKKVDTNQTVIMVQPENEIGMVELARDYSPTANKLYAANVPKKLMQYLGENKESLAIELKKAWGMSNFAKSGSWSEVFGDTAQGEEIFMAWYFAVYTEQVTKAGKEEYPLPMYVNAALIRPGYQPGQYVSAGPLPHLIDIWRAGSPSIDFISPDIYFPNFTEWAELYTRGGNPLFIPEATRGNTASTNSLFAFAEHDAIGFAPFGIESISGHAKNLLTNAYGIIKQLEPLILEHQGQGTMRGFLQISDAQRAPQQIRLGGYEMNARFEYATPPPLADGVINETGDVSRGPKMPAGGFVIQLGEDEFLFGGIGITITFNSLNPGEQIGIVYAESGEFVEDEWENRLWRNGDQTHQGRHVRLVPGQFGIQKVKLYRYK